MASPKFLVVRRDNIGDLVCTTPLLAALRAHYPQAWIGVLANSYNAPVLEGNPDINEVFAYRKAKHGGTNALKVAFERVRILRALRKERVDFAIVATPALDLRGVRAARWSGAKQVIAFAPGQRLLDGVDVTIACDDMGDASEVELVWRLAGPLGLAGVPPALKVIPPAEVITRVNAAMAESMRVMSAHGPIVGIHLSARKPSQRWPVERYAELMDAIHRASDARFLVFWAPGDAANPRHPGDDAKAQVLLAACSTLPVMGWPTVSLHELIGAMAVCDRMVMADGGAMHIAAALGKPILALFGDSDAHRWRPWGVRHEVLQTASRDVADITVNAALASYHRLDGLSSEKSSPAPTTER
jgi:heptosyltransferase III